MNEHEKLVPTTYHIREAQREAIRTLAFYQRTPAAALVREALADYLSKNSHVLRAHGISVTTSPSTSLYVVDASDVTPPTLQTPSNVEESA